LLEVVTTGCRFRFAEGGAAAVAGALLKIRHDPWAARVDKALRCSHRGGSERPVQVISMTDGSLVGWTTEISVPEAVRTSRAAWSNR